MRMRILQIVVCVPQAYREITINGCSYMYYSLELARLCSTCTGVNTHIQVYELCVAINGCSTGEGMIGS